MGEGQPIGLDPYGPCLVVVAAPAAAGKSTFIADLRAGRLPPEILGLLPRKSDSWPQIFCSDVPGFGESEDGAIFHLATSNSPTVYECFLTAILRQAATTIVVHLEATPAHLVENVRRRMRYYFSHYLNSGTRRSKSSLQKIGWRIALRFRSPWFAARAGQTSLLEAYLKTERRLQERIATYGDPAALDGIYAVWREALHRATRVNAGGRLIEMHVACATVDKRPIWTLMNVPRGESPFRPSLEAVAAFGPAPIADYGLRDPAAHQLA